MDIKIRLGGDWGGVIPDALRNEKLVIAIGDEIEITMQEDNLKELIGLTEESVQKLWEKCVKIVHVSDAQDDMMRKFSHIMEAAYQETDPRYPPSKEEFDKIMDAFFEFRNGYWDVSIEAGGLTK